MDGFNTCLILLFCLEGQGGSGDCRSKFSRACACVKQWFKLSECRIHGGDAMEDLEAMACKM